MPGRNLMLRLAVASAAAGLLVTGLVLLIRALWLVLAASLGAIWANVTLGSALVLVGGITFLALAARKRPPTPTGLPRNQIVDLVLAFLEGLAAGRRSHRDDD